MRGLQDTVAKNGRRSDGNKPLMVKVFHSTREWRVDCQVTGWSATILSQNEESGQALQMLNYRLSVQLPHSRVFGGDI